MTHKKNTSSAAVLKTRTNPTLLKRTEDVWINRIWKFCGTRANLAQRVAGIVLWDFADALGGNSEQLSELAWQNPHMPIPDVPDAEIEKILVAIGYSAEAARLRAETPPCRINAPTYPKETLPREKEGLQQWMMG